MSLQSLPYLQNIQNIKISYETDEEYRKCLGLIFGSEYFGVNNTEDSDGGDVLSIIYAATSADPRFANLYNRCAALLLSDDPTTGIAILFSYSCFAKFHALLTLFMSNREEKEDNGALFDELNFIISSLGKL